jgi:hypothetical protein
MYDQNDQLPDAIFRHFVWQSLTTQDSQRLCLKDWASGHANKFVNKLWEKSVKLLVERNRFA